MNFQTFSDYFCFKLSFSLCVYLRFHHVPVPGPWWCQDIRNGPAWITKGLALFLKPWYTWAVEIHFSQTFIPSLSLVCTEHEWYLWWQKWGLKALKFLQLHLFKQFLIILPWNYKTSGTRANLPGNCTPSICKGSQIRCRLLSAKWDSCVTWAPQHPSPQLKTLGHHRIWAGVQWICGSLPFPGRRSFQGVCPWAKERKPKIKFSPGPAQSRTGHPHHQSCWFPLVPRFPFSGLSASSRYSSYSWCFRAG